MDSSQKLSTCYNKGCGTEFDPLKNDEESCVYHSGEPYFHDAYKGWSCCNKKSIDFTDFLNIKGCTRGKHNGTKVVEELPNPPVKNDDFEKKHVTNKFHKVFRERPSKNTPLVPLRINISPSLQQELSKLNESLKDLNVSGITEVPEGTACQNSGCQMTFKKGTLMENCVFHNGTPVFHEGLKFWSCCEKKCTDFTKFLDTPGCVLGNHVWIKKKETTNLYRWDWYQTVSDVVFTVYVKEYEPNRSSILASPVHIQIRIYFPKNEDFFEKLIDLCEMIDVDKSIVNMLSTKVEIILKKLDSAMWPRLDFNETK